MAKDDVFIGHIKDGFSKFSIEVDSHTPLDKDLHRLVLTDKVNSVSYIALARRKDAGKPENFWSDVLDNILSPQLSAAAEEGGVPPAALVVPSVEGETVIALAERKGAKPTAYQLFDGFVVVGFRRFDSEKLIHPSSPKSDDKEKDGENTPTEVIKAPEAFPEAAPASSETTSAEIPETVLLEQAPPDEKKPLSLKKLAAAALLGVSIASIPFAINKFSGGDGNESPVHNLTENEIFVRDHVLNDAVAGREADTPLLKVLAQNAPLSADNLRFLIDKGYAYDVAQNPALSKELLKDLAASKDPDMRLGVSANANLPKDIAADLSKDKEPAVRRAVAKNPNLPEGNLFGLTKDTDELTRFAVLDSPNLTPAVLDTLEPIYTDASCDNRAKIYASPCVNLAQLEYHKKNPDPCIRRGIARNPNAPEAVLTELAGDNDPQVKRGALSNPSLKNFNFQKYFPVGWLSDNNPENNTARRALLENPNIPAGLLKSAALNKPAELGTVVAGNPNTPKPVLDALFNYATGRGGVDGFLNEAAALTEDKRILSDSEGRPADLAPVLKPRLQKAFRENIYDPEGILMFTRNAGYNPVGGDNLTLEDFERGGEFFDEINEKGLTLEEPSGDFEEFFGETADAFEKGILETADRIVNSAMNAVAPLIERKFAAAGSSGGSMGPNEASGGISSGVSSLGVSSAGVSAGSGENPNLSVPARFPNRSVFSEELYQNACRDLENLSETR
jgi:hypothetical protein